MIQLSFREVRDLEKMVEASRLELAKLLGHVRALKDCERASAAWAEPMGPRKDSEPETESDDQVGVDTRLRQLAADSGDRNVVARVEGMLRNKSLGDVDYKGVTNEAEARKAREAAGKKT